MSKYKERNLEEIKPLLQKVVGTRSCLDFGSGDGWYAEKINKLGKWGPVTAVDIKRRESSLYPSTIYDGQKLPFQDNSFDLVYCVDVMHHCNDPAASFSEISRVARKFLIIKDHRYTNFIGKLALTAMDEIGNRRFGVPSPQNYQRDWEWRYLLETLGWQEDSLLHPIKVHASLLGSLTNTLQYASLFKKDFPKASK